MTEMGAYEAKNTLGHLLDLAERGEEVTITRHGRPVARLVPALWRLEVANALTTAARCRLPRWIGTCAPPPARLASG
jgi:prevent-host-death family protein